VVRRRRWRTIEELESEQRIRAVIRLHYSEAAEEAGDDLDALMDDAFAEPGLIQGIVPVFGGRLLREARLMGTEERREEEESAAAEAVVAEADN